ncbi:MAG: chorismate synthase [Ferruginibacter sp.]|nr:chorismate synthase [Ferruginibacter sp.]
MNAIGKIFTVQIWGESHGMAVGCVLDGCPPGIPLNISDFEKPLQRRKGGGAGTTPRTETDIPVFVSGVFNGCTTGAPLCIQFNNANTRNSDYEAFKQQPRPGHADFVSSVKYKGFQDYRGGGHFSGRLTTALVAAGVVAEKLLKSHLPDCSCNATVLSIGGNNHVEEAVQEAIASNDTVGAVVECRMSGLPIGLGEPFFNSCESVISHLVFSIPAVKAIEFGSGFGVAQMKGSEHNDVFINEKGTTATNHSGGITGGLTNGNELVFRIAVKPASSTPKPQQTYNYDTGTMETLEIKGRHDLIIALRVPPVLEAVTMIAMADLFMCAKANGTV